MENNDTIKIIVAGDIIPPSQDSIIYSKELQHELDDKDFSIVNLEAPFTHGLKAVKKNGKSLKSSPKSVKHIKDGYFDAVSLSNNHIRDFGDVGVIETLNVCKDNNIKTVGAGKNLAEAKKPLRVTLKGKTITFLNYSEHELNLATKQKAGANPYDIIRAFMDIKKQNKESDYVIVIYHGGLEYHNVPLPSIKERLIFMIENGADAVICHHTHYISGYSLIKGKPIIYGLGNFYYKSISKVHKKNDELHMGLLLRLTIENSKIQFKLLKVEKTSDQSKLALMDDTNSQNDLRDKINSINKLINNGDELQNYWDAHKTFYKNQYYASILSRNRLIRIIYKSYYRRFPVSDNNSHISKLLNLYSCDSHREMIVRSFSN